MKKVLLYSLFMLMLFVNSAFSGEKNYSDGEVLVVFKAPAGVQVSASGLGAGGELRASVTKAASEVDSEVLDVYDTISELDGNIFVLLRSKTKTTEELIRELKARPDVVSVSPNYKVRHKSKPVSSAVGIRPNDVSFDKLWGLEAIRAPEAWEETTGSEEIYAAVLDSGVFEHDDLIDNIAYDLVSDSNAMWSFDVLGHGTHIAGIIGAVGNNKIGVTGVNWDVKIIPVLSIENTNDDDSSNNPLISGIIKGLSYISSLLKNDPDLKIASVNISLGWFQDQTPEEIKQEPIYLAFKAFDNLDRTLIVVAASNEGFEVGKPVPFDEPQAPSLPAKPSFTKGQYSYPASFSGINNLIVVGATNSDGNAPYFTNWGSSVDIAAPGDNILSTYSPLVELMKKYQQNPSEEPDLDNMEDAEIYKYLGGTSMAAPYVTGACALLLSKYPDATPSEIKNALLEGANRNINPTVHPFASFDEQLKTVADEAGVPYEDVKDVTPDTTVEELRELLYEKYFSNDPFSFLAFFTAFGKIKASVEAYKILDGKGKVSRTGLLDLKAALDVLAKDSGSNFVSSSSSGCNTGLEGVFASLAAGIAIILMKKHKD